MPANNLRQKQLRKKRIKLVLAVDKSQLDGLKQPV